METLAKPLSRRRFAQLLGFGAAATALPGGLAPVLAETAPALRRAAKAAAAAPARVATAAGEVVRLSSNENPYGPSPAAFEAMRQAFSRAWRYPDEGVDALAEQIAAAHGVGADNVLLGDGSSEILKLCAAAFSGPGRPPVITEPTC